MASLILECHSGSPSDESVGTIFSSTSVDPKVGRRHYPKGKIAREQDTALSQLDWLLDPQNTAVSLVTLARVAALSGKRLVVEIRDQYPVKIIEAKKKDSLPPR
jgi:hypothetical protein